MVQLRLHNGGYYVHAQVLNAYNFCLSLNSINLIECLLDNFQRATWWHHIKIKMADIMHMRKF